MHKIESSFDMAVPDWNSIPQVAVSGQASIDEHHVVTVPTDAGKLFFSLHPHGVRLRSESSKEDQFGILKQDPECLPWTLSCESEQTTVSGDNLTLVINHEPLAFSVYKQGKLLLSTSTDGHFVRRYRLPPMAKVPQGWLLSLALKAGEPVYGLGEKWGKLDKRGQFIRSFNHDALGVNAEISYKNTPFAWSTNGWGVFTHTPSPVLHAVGYAPWSQRSYAFVVEDDDLDVFLFSGDTGAEIIDKYTDLTGKAPVPPLWSLGVILSKAYYKDVPELFETADAVRENNMPCDVITLDGRAWQDTDTRFAFEWDPKRFDDPAAVVNRLKEQNFKICIWEYPLVSVENKLFDEMASKGWLLKDKRTGEAYRYQWDMSAFGEVLTPLPESGIVDFTHPDAFAFWRDAHKDLFDLGVDMIKADFGEQVEDDNMLSYSGDSGMRLHNVYSLLYNRCVYEAAKTYSQNGPFLFSRSAWSGSQCYPSQWGGDPQADWGGLAGSIRGALSWGMSGAPYFATDVGGFYKDTRDAELFVRWTQAAVFSAHMRLHGIGQREPWSYGEEAEQAANKALALRYQLLPYIENLMHQASETGLPVMRAMALAFPQDRAAWAFEEQFMFGDDMLVVPCVEPGGEVEFYLPQGTWLDFNTGEAREGGQVYRQSTALDDITVFVRQGSRIPLGPDVEHTEALDGKSVIDRYWPECLEGTV